MRLAPAAGVARSRVLPLALASCALVLGDAQARTPDALECQSRVWKAVADVAPSCRGRDGARVCAAAALGLARNQAARILAKRQAATPPDACVPYACAGGESPFICANRLVNGAEGPELDTVEQWHSSDFRCLRKSARLLGRVAKDVRRCQRAGAEAAACTDEVAARSTTKLEGTIDSFLTAGASLHRCLLGGCPANADLPSCVQAVVLGTDVVPPPPPGGGDPPPGGDPPGDMTAQEIECRSVSPVVLAEFDARVAKCVADADDVRACVLEARVKREEKVAGLLDKRVRPDVCFPGICTADQTPDACAATVFDLHDPTDSPPPGDDGGGDDPPTPAEECRNAARAIIRELADDVAHCRSRVEADPGFDVDACLQGAVAAHRPDLLAHLEAQVTDGIPPDQCLPILCATSGNDVTACADAAVADVLANE